MTSIMRCILSFVVLILIGTLDMGATRPATCCPVVELRQYTVVPGKLDDFVRLYDSRFIESQELAGIELPGQFRVVGNPNKFDWLQGFASMQERLASFKSFYHGKAWRANRSLVNRMLLENGNVLLLQPAHAGSGFSQSALLRPSAGSARAASGLLVVTIQYLGANSSTGFDHYFEHAVRPLLERHGARVIATFVTNHSPNNFPGLPVRDDVNVFAWFACFANLSAYDRFQATLDSDPDWWTVQGQLALDQMYLPTEVHRLEPTPRSALRCNSVTS